MASKPVLWRNSSPNSRMPTTQRYSGWPHSQKIRIFSQNPRRNSPSNGASAQLRGRKKPENASLLSYMYTRSMIYSLDNYSTTGNSGIAGADQELDIPGGSYARHGGDALALERANRQSLPKSPVSQQHNAERSGCDTERHNRRALDQRFRQ